MSNKIPVDELDEPIANKILTDNAEGDQFTLMDVLSHFYFFILIFAFILLLVYILYRGIRNSWSQFRYIPWRIGRRISHREELGYWQPIFPQDHNANIIPLEERPLRYFNTDGSSEW